MAKIILLKVMLMKILLLMTIKKNMVLFCVCDFQYKHHAGQETRIDPSVSNIVDVYMLERTYDNLFRIWLQDGGTKPSTPLTMNA